MFTFGREHEIKHATAVIGGPEKAELLINVIHAVHDFLEGEPSLEEALKAMQVGFSGGKSGVWEYTGSWIRKLGQESPDALELWRILARDKSYLVRFRVACFLHDMPHQLAIDLGHSLATDKSKKVRTMALARLKELGQ